MDEFLQNAPGWEKSLGELAGKNPSVNGEDGWQAFNDHAGASSGPPSSNVAASGAARVMVDNAWANADLWPPDKHIDEWLQGFHDWYSQDWSSTDWQSATQTGWSSTSAPADWQAGASQGASSSTAHAPKAEPPWSKPQAKTLPPPPVPTPPPPKQREGGRLPRARGGKNKEWHSMFHLLRRSGSTVEQATAAANAAHPKQ